jgi:hypothetical protein
MDRDREIADQRLWNLLEGARFGSPRQAVGWLTAVQAQEYLPSLWSIAQRMDPPVDEATLLAAVDEGELLRTHVLRPTWHLASPEDLRLLLAATAGRVHTKNAYPYRQHGLDERTRGRTRALIADLLAGGNHLTRTEIRERLAERGIEAAGQRLAYTLMDAELQGVVCSGARRGKQHTYALLDERAPTAPRTPDAESAVIELVRRYLAAHGPATIKDLQAWASLRLADLRPAFEELRDELVTEDHAGRTYWDVLDRPPPATPPSPVHLLQGYDEYMMGYLDSRHVIDLAGRAESLHPDAVIPNHVVLVDGQLAGNFRRTRTTDRVMIEVYLYEPPDDRVVRALEAATHEHARFLRLTGELVVHDHLSAPRRFGRVPDEDRSRSAPRS